MGLRIGQKSALALKGHPEAARGPSGGLLGPFGDQFWVTFGPHLGPIFELPQADFRATATATAATAVATHYYYPPPPPTLAPQGLQLWSLWFYHSGLGSQHQWNRSRNRLLVFRFRAFRSRVLGFSSGGPWALAWGHGL